MQEKERKRAWERVKQIRKKTEKKAKTKTKTKPGLVRTHTDRAPSPTKDADSPTDISMPQRWP
jgi:hypothetical protein